MADGATSNLAFILPEVGASTSTWGTKVNANFTQIDGLFDETTGHAHTGVAGAGPKLTPPALTGISAVGFVVNTNDAVFAPRTIVNATNGGLTITNGSGAAGNPTLALNPTNLTAETTVASDDEVPFADTSAAGAARKATRTNFLKGATHTSPNLAFNAEGSITGAKTLNLANHSFFSGTSVGNTTWTFGTPPSSGLAFGFVLELTNGGAFTQTWPASVKWPNGTAPSLAASGVDVLAFITRDGGATWRGVLSMADSR